MTPNPTNPERARILANACAAAGVFREYQELLTIAVVFGCSALCGECDKVLIAQSERIKACERELAQLEKP
jgi:hypothetical protein